MDDKALKKIDELLAHMAKCLIEIRAALPVVIATTPEEREVLKRRMQEAAKAHGGGPVQQLWPLMSGRWHRRDGDVYGIVTQPRQVEPEKNADRPPGHIRPSDKR